MLRLPIRIYGFFRRNIVMTVAFLAAVVTSFIVPPDKVYLGYFDLKTLACLFSVLAVVCALRNIKFFTVLARKIVQCFGTVRMTLLALIYIPFIGSMLIANDMALLTFLPLGFFVLDSTGMRKYMAVTFIMQNIAANLGGMVTPFGNPQNLFMYSKFNIPTLDFVKVMAPPFAVAIVLITVICLFFPNEKMKLCDNEKTALPLWRTIVYLLLFALSIIIVFRVIPYYIGFAVILVSMLFLDRDALKKVDYPLLMTFTCFFVFSGNMGRIDAVRNFFSSFLEIDTLLFSSLSCQVISNVPSAILLSQFTDNWKSLLVGVNIGGAGTLIASLASLITFREYQLHNPQGTKKYIALFSAFNFGFLIVLYLFSHFVQGL